MLHVIKQHIKNSKYNTHTIRKMLHYSKNLFNEALYILRQNFFANKIKDKKDKIYLKYYDLYHLLKNSENFKLLQASVAQQIIKITYETFDSFIKLIKANFYANLPKYLKKDGYFLICDPDKDKRITKNKKNNQYYYTIKFSEWYNFKRWYNNRIT